MVQVSLTCRNPERWVLRSGTRVGTDRRTRTDLERLQANVLNIGDPCPTREHALGIFGIHVLQESTHQEYWGSMSYKRAPIRNIRDTCPTREHPLGIFGIHVLQESTHQEYSRYVSYTRKHPLGIFGIRVIQERFHQEYSGSMSYKRASFRNNPIIDRDM